MTGRIEICGGIASGKTTLATILAEASGEQLVLERFRDNPFFELFYQRPETFVAEKNVCFLAQHTGQIKEHDEGRLLVCDYAVVQDLAYARLTDQQEHVDLMHHIYRSLYDKVAAPSLIVHLTCDVDVLLNRIRARARPQEAGITAAYLRSLNDGIVHVLESESSGVPVRTICSHEVDFAHDSEVSRRLAEELLGAR